ncbi:MAG TPA: KpsF/GutQ family sugar-phosphate isomerase [Flavobacterium sp.]|nr:KpsF/GutQ family sugar-phosphate isomerase [Flavobacterium sp.]
MISNENILAVAKKTIISESNSIAKLNEYLNDDFLNSINAIYNCKGRVIVSGIGKSAIIAQKIVATFNSTGTPSIFLHASEAIHGDLGMVLKDDVIICISKSGNSPEIKILTPLLKRFGNILIGMTGNMTSFLAKGSDFVLNTTVESESCRNNLAPTNSTTAQLVMGDVLAVCLMEIRNFSAEDFAIYHPGGSLGKQLLLKVSSMLENSFRPMVPSDASIKNVIFEISEKRLGVTAVMENNKIIGIITDGDIRRMLNDRESIAGITAKDIMTKNPKSVKSTDMVVDAFNLMEDFKITQLIVVDNEEYKGVLHLHDILKEGIV